MRIDIDRPTGRPPVCFAGWARRAGVLSAVVGVTMLGNLRLQASEVGQFRSPSDPASAQPAAAATAPVSIERVDLAVAPDRKRTHAITGKEDGDAEDDSVQLVPAIYAWDPDVRFVYFRHVSKWM